MTGPEAGQAAHAGHTGHAHDGPGAIVEPLARVFARFLRFGLLAFGGPAAQIAMLRGELVERERWVEPARFDRALAVYQALPGPEALELCTYLGSVRRGRAGGVVAGLGFMLPGAAFMLVLAWAYARLAGAGGPGAGGPGAGGGGAGAGLSAALLGAQAAVAGLVVVAATRLARRMLTDAWRWAVMLLALAGTLAGVPFWITLTWAALAYACVRLDALILAGVITGLFLAGGLPWAAGLLGSGQLDAQTLAAMSSATAAPAQAAASLPGAMPDPGLAQIALTNTKAGLLSFGGAYAALPFLEQDAVLARGGGQTPAWMTPAEFAHGVALNAVIPAPLVTVGTFVGYAGGGPAGALVATACIFAPAFAFTLVGHRVIERLVRARTLHGLLEGVAAASVGLIVSTAISLGRAALMEPAGAPGGATLRPLAGAVALAAMVTLVVWRSRWATPAVVLSGTLAGIAAWVAWGR